MDSHIIFNQNSTDNFHYRKLKKQIDHEVKGLPKSRMVFKIAVTWFFILMYFVIYAVALNSIQNINRYYLLFALMGVIIVFIFLNIIHDAVHNHVFKTKRFNNAVLIVFDLIGANSYIWKNRHIHLHHNFQNVVGWDSDIEQSGLIKIFPHDKSTWIHRYQHWFIFIFYPLYLFNWIMIRDFKDFFSRDRMVKKVIAKIPLLEYVKLFFFKLLFIFYMVILPIMLGQKVAVAIASLCLMLIVGGVLSLLILLTPHANVKNEFPLPDSQGNVNVSWFKHQFFSTNDVNLNNWFSRNLMGNFNFHIAHHMFPNISPVYAPEVTQIIKNYAENSDYPYRSYSMFKALQYHYKLIKANAIDFNIFEEDM